MALDAGMSILTLMSLRDTGFDLYENYNASGCHGGTSGNGGTQTVADLLARKAFARALGWAAALSEAFPEDFDHANPDWPDTLSAAPPGDQLLQSEAICEYLDVHRVIDRGRPDEDTCRRACSRVRAVVAFAEAVYRGAMQSPVQLSFL